MPEPADPIAADYNPTGSSRARWVVPAAALLLAAAVLPFDGPVALAARRLQTGGEWALGGDVRRTIEFLQQFGDAASSIVIGIAVLMLDRARRARVLDWAAGALATSLAVHALKMLAGRPRPRVAFGAEAAEPLASHRFFAGPWRAVLLPREGQPGGVSLHSWEFWRGVGSDLASMPSSHTSAAAALAAALAAMYPRLTPLVVSLMIVVGVSRAVTGAHYPSDVLVGGAIGWVVTSMAMRGRWGQRLARVPEARRV
jgi:membrane-associated phospholipid phosphatase